MRHHHHHWSYLVVATMKFFVYATVYCVVAVALLAIVGVWAVQFVVGKAKHQPVTSYYAMADVKHLMRTGRLSSGGVSRRRGRLR